MLHVFEKMLQDQVCFQVLELTPQQFAAHAEELLPSLCFALTPLLLVLITPAFAIWEERFAFDYYRSRQADQLFARQAKHNLHFGLLQDAKPTKCFAHPLRYLPQHLAKPLQ